ncbi:MAG TPA: YbhB/YbcL family Raf kinase inhibitor-like protein [Blastocatellia bacterium]|nr:YbhB/YbcL family Raf kinase inhibitor-like protein [Blastocatellia bacterium]
MNFEITSDAFASGQNIPSKYTCDGQNISPPLKWSGAPQGTRSFALIVEDPDAPSGTFDHWLLFNIPAATTELSEGLPGSRLLDYGARQGINGFKKIGYSGPCPPQNESHRYLFHLYALNIELSSAEGATKNEIKRAMEGAVIAQATLTGTYARMKASEKASRA